MPSGFMFNRPVFGNMVSANPFGETFYVSNTTNPTEFQGAPGPTAQGRSPKRPFTTLQAAVDASVSGRGDTIVVQRGGSYAAPTVDKAGLTFIGAVPYGYPDHVVISGITTITASNVSFYNIEFFSNSADAASVIVGLFSAGVNSSWFENCSFASDGTTEPEVGAVVWGGNNHTFKNCRFIDNTFGLVLRSNTDNLLTHLVIDNCEFFENTTADVTDLEVAAAAATVANYGGVGGAGVAQGVGNLKLYNSFFGTGAVTPTDFININGASSGTIANCAFGSTAHASATITIPTGIFYSVNSTEEGLTGQYSGNIGTSGRPD